MTPFLAAKGEACSLVTMICDDGARYLNSYYSQEWLNAKRFDLEPYLAQLQALYETGKMDVADVG